MLVGFLTSLLLAVPVCHLQRDENGRIVRNKEQRALFRAISPCPSTGKLGGVCRGYVVDHICPLSCCGKDDPGNMQWQTKAEARAKDAWEQDCSSCPRTEASGPRHVEEAWPPAIRQQPKARTPTATCRDGTHSYSARRSGTCNHHGGVDKWLIEPTQ